MTSVQESVLSGVMNSPDWARQAWDRITPEYFTGELRVAADAAYQCWQKEKTCEPNAVMAMLIALGYTRRFSGGRLLDIYQNGFPLSDNSFRMLVSHLEEEHQRRQAALLADRIASVAATPGSDFHLEISALATELTLAAQTRQTSPVESTITLQELLDTDFPEDGDVVPGLFKPRSRVVITGPEGRGKSELMYQVALGAARGVQPFSTETFPQRKVLIVDAENQQYQLQKRLRRINAQYDGLGCPDVGENLRIQDALGWNLLDPSDSGYLFALVREYMPDILMIGPVYQVMGGDANDAETVRRFMRVVDECRLISNCAVLTEAHAGHGESGNRNGWRPSGSSLWLRWPEMGIGLSPLDDSGAEMELKRWRGDREQNDWPDMVRRGGFLPWTEAL